MFLLNDGLIQKYRNDGRLGIEPFYENDLNPTSYYFRLGDVVELFGPPSPTRTLTPAQVFTITEDRPDPVILPPRGYALIRSKENFRLTNQVLGIFGQTSEMTTRGLRLVHSPYIDPTFEGILKMGLQNMLDEKQPLGYDVRIGKVSFFDLTDTYPIGVLKKRSTGEEIKRAPT